MAKGNPQRRADAILFTGLPDEAVTLDAVAFDNLIHHNGVKLIHHRAIRCPVGLQDESDIHRTHPDHTGCSNGFIYKAIGRVTTVFTSNAMDPRKMDEGFVDGSTVSVTFPRFYDSDESKRVMVRPYDRFYLEEENIVTAIWDLTTRRQDGLADRFEFPAVKVEHLIDSTGTWYYEGTDFDLIDGNLVWRPLKGPAPRTVYSAWYMYRPFYYCDRLVHEIRVTPTPDFINTAEVHLERLSFGAILHREYVYRNQENDEQAPDNHGRKQRAPDTLAESPDAQDDFGSR